MLLRHGNLCLCEPQVLLSLINGRLSTHFMSEHHQKASSCKMMATPPFFGERHFGERQLLNE
jgi:hypothetical protein